MGDDVDKLMSDQFSIDDSIKQNFLIMNLHVNVADELLKDDIKLS